MLYTSLDVKSLNNVVTFRQDVIKSTHELGVRKRSAVSNELKQGKYGELGGHLELLEAHASLVSRLTR